MGPLAGPRCSVSSRAELVDEVSAIHRSCGDPVRKAADQAAWTILPLLGPSGGQVAAGAGRSVATLTCGQLMPLKFSSTVWLY